MTDRKITEWLLGPHTAFGLLVAVVVCAIDQGSKLWLLFVYGLAGKGAVAVLPFIDFVLVWNRGISYGLFQQDSGLGQWVLLGVTVVAIALLQAWLAQAASRLTAVALGLVIGGAVGNAIDRLITAAHLVPGYEGVVDFVLFHIRTATFSFNWYVFNLADAAIVAGVIGLLYESLIGERAVKAP